jgi:hypothetical protein
MSYPRICQLGLTKATRDSKYPILMVNSLISQIQRAGVYVYEYAVPDSTAIASLEQKMTVNVFLISVKIKKGQWNCVS